MNYLAGRPQQLEAGNALTTDANSTSFDETKIYLVLCYSVTCKFFGHRVQSCFCCGQDGDHEESCYETMRECRAKCPKFPPSKDSMTTNATVHLKS